MIRCSPTGKLRAQILIAAATGEQPESLGDGVDDTIGNFYTATFAGSVEPDAVELSFGVWKQMKRPSSLDVRQRDELARAA